jgi:2-amino-4-hydroxy-6-hydroxymethyldihydropteridine diphosphokinase
MNNVYLSLGSNEGDRIGWMQKAMEMLSVKCGPVVQRSSVYQTAAWGLTSQPDFLNMVILLQTTKTPAELLIDIHNIETTLGRRRDIKWGPRTLDIDILLYNDLVTELPELTIPHPYMQDRRFTLVPLAEIAPTYIHPKFNVAISELLSRCPDQLEVHKYIP